MTSRPLALDVWKDGERVARVEVSSRGLTLGRAPDNDVVLPHSTVSGRHARLQFEGQSLVLIDLQSSGGTRVNGELVDRAVLAPAAELSIGPYTLRLAPRGEPPAEQPAAEFQRFVGRLLDLTRVVGAADLEVVLDSLLERTITLFDATRGLIVLARGGRLSAILVRSRGMQAGDTQFSRTVCEMAMTSGKPVVLASPDDWNQVGQAASLNASTVGMVLAMPLLEHAEVLGVLYLEGNPFPAPVLKMRVELLREVSLLGARALRAALDREQILAEKERWRWVATTSTDLPDLFRTARSPAMQQVLGVIERAAGEDLSVLVLGESGTGKEVVAHAIHALSPRRSGPFVAINCAAIPHDLVEAELFGHEKGAFTGAAGRKIGRLEMAQGGTLLLDEIGDLPREVQVKLLRVLEARTFERVGGQETIHWDARLVAATHRDLSRAIAAGEFRADLYYRIDVVSVRLPALRERPEDIELIAHELLLFANRRLRRKLLGITPEALMALRQYPWPGNIREMKNVIERAFVLETTDRITLASLSLPAPSTAVAGAVAAPVTSSMPSVQQPLPSLEEFLETQEREFIKLVLDRMGGNITRAAQAMKLPRQTLHRKLRELGIRRE